MNPSIPSVPPAVKPRSSRRLRGSRACDCCHARKVRCDIDLNGPGKPCTNCRLDGQACVSYRGSKSRLGTTRPASKAEVTVKTQERAQRLPDATVTPQELRSTSPVERLPAKRLFPKQSVPANVTACIDLRIVDLWMQAASGTTTPLLRSRQIGTSNKQAPDLMDIPRLRFGELNTSRGLDDHITFSYYDFLNLKSLPKMQRDDVRYLEFTGSLHIPMRPVLDEFVREYFLHVHPILPVIDERAFWSMYDESMTDMEKPGRLSLFVFQSMLFAACATVPLDVLRCCGFSTVRQARETFYRRAKTIFDLGKESDYHAVAQGALLLTYYTTNTDSNINSHWLGIAILNARVINAQLYHRDQCLSDMERRAKKRLWWCCILRDRIMPLGMRRAIQITNEHFDFSQTFNEEDLDHEIGFSRVYDVESQRQIVKTIAAQCGLAVILTGVLSTCYPLDGSHSIARFSPPDLEITKERIQQNRLKLVEWFTTFNLQAPPQTETNNFHISVTLYTNLLYIYYHSARLALCQHEILVLESYEESSEGGHAQNLHHAKSEMRSATIAITEIVKALIWMKAAQYLPISAVAYTALPLVLTALDLKMSSDTTQAIARRHQLEVYVEAMRLYRAKYDGTEGVTAVIERLLNDAEPEARRICSTSSTTTSQRSLVLSGKSKDWSDILNQRPKFYLRLTLALDMALARGKFPEEADFPSGCRIAEIDGKDNEGLLVDDKINGTSYGDISMPCMQSSGTSTPRNEFHELLQSTEQPQVNLDFADLFGDHTQSLEYDGPHGYMDEVQALFDFNVAV